MSRIPWRPARPLCWCVCLVALLVVFAPINASWAGLKRSWPYAPGERLEYEIYWTVVYAGTASVSVLPDTEIKGIPARHFRAEARSSPFIDSFYKVRDTIDSWTDMTVDRTLRFEQYQREGDYHRDTILDMDWTAGRVDRYGKKGFKNSLDLPGDVLDPLAILFHFRTHWLFKDRVVSGWVTDGKKMVNGSGRVVGRETLDTPFGPLDCFRVEPETKDLGGVFKKSDDARIEMWFTADDRRIPVRIRSKVVVGHFSLELVDAKGVPGLVKLED